MSRHYEAAYPHVTSHSRAPGMSKREVFTKDFLAAMLLREDIAHKNTLTDSTRVIGFVQSAMLLADVTLDALGSFMPGFTPALVDDKATPSRKGADYNILSGEVFEHFKTGDRYVVLGFVTNEKDGAKYVLYTSYTQRNADRLVRPLDEWREDVQPTPGGEWVPRYRRVIE